MKPVPEWRREQIRRLTERRAAAKAQAAKSEAESAPRDPLKCSRCSRPVALDRNGFPRKSCERCLERVRLCHAKAAAAAPTKAPKPRTLRSTVFDRLFGEDAES